MQEENEPKEVSAIQTKHNGQAPSYRECLGAEPCVWTDRMLAALKSRVQVKKWFSLRDKLYRLTVLVRAWEQVKSRRGSGGIDKVSIQQFEKHALKHLLKLQRELQEGTYKPSPVKRVYIPKAGSKEKRPLGIPTIRDRVVQTALLYVIGPIFENEFHRHSYGFRPRLGCKDALREVDHLLKTDHQWVVDADLKSYFDTIDHKQLMDCVKERIADGLIIDLIEKYLKQGVMNSLGRWEATDQGSPQGAVISPLLANLYLNEMDHMLSAKGYQCIRYADDFVVLCRSKTEANEALLEVKSWSDQKNLSLHPEKTKLVHHNEGFEFLGYQFIAGRRYVRKKSMKKLRESIKPRTKRTNGQSMQQIIDEINPTLFGWFVYFKHAHKTTFRGVDGWVRMRLRSILRKRHRKKGRGRGSDHQRWPNQYFADLGLFSLEQAHKNACQSR